MVDQTTPLRKGQKTYQSILDAAIEIISEKGVSGISALQLSKISGISKSSVFHHFSSVDDIPIIIMKMILDEVKKPIQELEADSLYGYLSMLGTLTIQLSKQDKKIYMCLLSFYHESLFHKRYQVEMKEFLQESKIELMKRLKFYLAKDTSEAKLESVALSLLASLDGFGLNVMLNNKTDQYIDAWNNQVHSICLELGAI